MWFILGFDMLSPSIRIIAFYWVNVCAAFYTFGYRTAHTRKQNRMAYFNEACFWLMMLHLMLFTDFIPDRGLRYNLGYGIIALVSLNISFSMVVTFAGIYRAMYWKRKRKLTE